MIYEIGGKNYEQRPLVLGQIQQLLRLLKGLSVPQNAGVPDIAMLLGDRTSAALAIVLIPEGTKLRDKDMAELQAEIEDNFSPEQVIQVIKDFFICTPLVSVLDRLTELAGVIETQTEKMRTSSNGSSSPSVGQT